MAASDGRLEEALALANAAIALDASSPRALTLAGSLLTLLGRHVEAAAQLARALELDPENVVALNGFGALLRSTGKAREAQPYFERALDLDPTFHEALANALGHYLETRAFERGIARVYAAVGAGDQQAETWVFLGTLLSRAGDDRGARDAFARATALEPGNADAWHDLADTSLSLGDLDTARAAMLKAIELAPDRPEFYRRVAAHLRDALTPAHRAALEAFVGDTSLSSEARLEAHFALGDLEQAAGHRREAFDHYVCGNALLRELIPYDEGSLLQRFEDVARVFTGDMIAKGSIGLNDSDLPVFIIGMPRSGTTLVEQIVASHPLAFAGGELELFHDLALEEFAVAGPVRAALAHRYEVALRRLSPTAARITDKMPGNFIHVGLIRMIFPRARIIHVRRDPLDACWSCFSTRFTEAPMIWSSDLGTLGRYYRAYAGLMSHWRSVLPAESMLEVRYEEIVADFEAQARRIIAYCGLPWDERCLEFHKTERSVRTASLSQVRRPLYASSVRASRAYGNLLDPLREALGPYAPVD
ncbi:MAG: sulfotransferase [bacterium]|nr:sulfotransferase [bacterium]